MGNRTTLGLFLGIMLVLGACLASSAPLSRKDMVFFGTLAENYPYEVVVCRDVSGNWRVPKTTHATRSNVLHAACPPGSTAHWHSHPWTCVYSVTDIQSGKEEKVQWHIVSLSEKHHCWWTHQQVMDADTTELLPSIKGQRTW